MSVYGNSKGLCVHVCSPVRYGTSFHNLMRSRLPVFHWCEGTKPLVHLPDVWKHMQIL